MSEYESPDRSGREPTAEDVRALVGPSTPHFALQIRNRLRNLVAGLPDDHPAKVEADKHIEAMERIAFEGETRGERHEGEEPLPSLADDGSQPTTS